MNIETSKYAESIRDQMIIRRIGIKPTLEYAMNELYCNLLITRDYVKALKEDDPKEYQCRCVILGKDYLEYTIRTVEKVRKAIEVIKNGANF